MPGLNLDLLDAKKRIATDLHEMRGIRFRYTHHRDTTATPSLTEAVLTIFGKPTPTTFEQRQQNGVLEEHTLDAFVFSREAFEDANGVFADPTYHDTFQELDDNNNPVGPFYEVRVIEPDEYGAVFMILGFSTTRKRPLA